MQDRPTAPELLDAMAVQLFTEVRDWVPRERRFQILVLANLCAVIARELRAGQEPSLADLELFKELGASADDPVAAAGEVAAAVRRGDLDGALPETIEKLKGHVARKLAIARPGYDGA